MAVGHREKATLTETRHCPPVASWQGVNKKLKVEEQAREEAHCRDHYIMPPSNNGKLEGSSVSALGRWRLKPMPREYYH